MKLKRVHGAFLILCAAVLIVSLLSGRISFKESLFEAWYDTQVPLADSEVPKPQPAEPSPNDSYTIRAEQLLREVMAEISELRNVTFTDVELEVVTKAWVIENWGRTAANQAAVDRLDLVYRGLFLTSQGETVYQAQLEWAGGFVAAELSGKIYVVRENFDPFDEAKARSTLAHELTHIVQDKNLKVPRFSTTYDGNKARLALIEGDATFTSEFFNNVTFAQVSSSAKTANGQFFPILLGSPLLNRIRFSLPRSVSSLNYFPYKYGLEFIRSLHLTGGWEAVIAAYADSPNSTEQVIHPEKYFAGEGPIKVGLPNVTDSSWKRKATDTYGEYFIQVMLEKWIPQAVAQKAASGWGGDNFTSYERGNDTLFVWNVTWDSALDATEFDEAFHAMTKATGAVEQDGIWCCDINDRFMTVKTEGRSTIILSSTSAAGVAIPQSNGSS